MIHIKFLDGSEKAFDKGITADEIAFSISPSLRKKCLAAKVNDKLVGLKEPINEDATLELITTDSKEAFEIINHSTAHLMAQAISNLWDNAKFGVGPAIETGFYYDVDVEPKITEADLTRIEKEMRRLVAASEDIEKIEVSKKEALDFFKHDPYKVELIEGLDDGTITFYKQGDFVDLCRGPHLPKTSYIKHFKLLSLAGAYWRGDSNNKQLQRIYGTSHLSKERL